MTVWYTFTWYGGGSVASTIVTAPTSVSVCSRIFGTRNHFYYRLRFEGPPPCAPGISMGRSDLLDALLLFFLADVRRKKFEYQRPIIGEGAARTIDTVAVGTRSTFSSTSFSIRSPNTRPYRNGQHVAHSPGRGSQQKTP